MGVRDLPGIDVKIESGLGFQVVPSRRFAMIVPGQGLLAINPLHYTDWSQVESDTLINDVLRKHLYDAFSNGARDVLVFHGGTIGGTPTWADYQAQILDLASQAIDWKDPDGFGIEFLEVLVSESPIQPTGAEYESFLSALGNLLTQAWQDDQIAVFAVVDTFTVTDVTIYLNDLTTATSNAQANWAYEGRVSVFSVFAKMLNPDGTNSTRSGLSAVAGKLAGFEPHWSLAWVEKGGLLGVLTAEPAFDNTQLTQLDQAFVNALRQWPGFGYAVQYDHMITKPTDDYQNIRYRRIVDEAIRGVMAAYRPWVMSPGVDAVALEALKADLRKPLDRMKVGETNPDGAILDYALDVWPDPDVLVNETIHAKVAILPVGSKKKLEITFKLSKEV